MWESKPIIIIVLRNKTHKLIITLNIVKDIAQEHRISDYRENSRRSFLISSLDNVTPGWMITLVAQEINNFTNLIFLLLITSLGMKFLRLTKPCFIGQRKEIIYFSRNTIDLFHSDKISGNQFSTNIYDIWKRRVRILFFSTFKANEESLLHDEDLIFLLYYKANGSNLFHNIKNIEYLTLKS